MDTELTSDGKKNVAINATSCASNVKSNDRTVGGTDSHWNRVCNRNVK